EQQNEIALDVGQERCGYGIACDRFFRGVERVHEFHDRRNAGVEVPASLEVVAHALDGLVQLALNRSRLGRERRCEQRLYGCFFRVRAMPYHETVDPSQESLNSFD